MLVFDRESWQRHRPWARAWLAITILLALFYVGCCLWWGRVLGGSSLPGLSTGIVAGLLILFETMFCLRKWQRVRGWYARRPAQVRLRQHIWLGLLTVPLVIVHSRLLHLGGWLTAALLLVFLVVIVSGIWGLAMQQWLPRKLLHDIPAETIRAQIPELITQLRGEATLLVRAACGPPSTPELVAAASGGPDEDLVHWIRSARQGKGTELLVGLPVQAIPDTRPLSDFFEQTIQPFLIEGRAVRSPLTTRHEATKAFDDLRSRLDPAAYETVDRLEALCSRRRQFDRQVRLHRWLHNWLYVHLPLSMALVVLLLWHAITAVMYW